VYKSQINDLQDHVDTLKSTYEGQIKNLITTYESQIEYIKEESTKKTNQLETKDKLLENMQVLLKETKDKVTLLEEQQPKKNIFKRIFSGKNKSTGE
jgi:predicted RNase H-like nuclease (RuvC/YqgF family)